MLVLLSPAKVCQDFDETFLTCARREALSNAKLISRLPDQSSRPQLGTEGARLVPVSWRIPIAWLLRYVSPLCCVSLMCIWVRWAWHRPHFGEGKPPPRVKAARRQMADQAPGSQWPHDPDLQVG